MANSLYLASLEPGSGRTVVLLGLMELLSRRVRRLGFFRPVVVDASSDPNIDLVSKRYNLAFPIEAMSGVARHEALSLASEGRTQELQKRILNRFRSLQRECDFVVCEGPDYSGVPSAFAFDFNYETANQLGTPVVLVTSGAERSADNSIERASTLRSAFEEKGCTILATFLNRLPVDQLERTQESAREAWRHSEPLFVVAEHPSLAKPTVGEVAKALHAELYMGDPESLDREVHAHVVAGMSLDNFLPRLKDQCLIVTSGDRASILLGSLATMYCESYPTIAGIVLTGGFTPSSAVQRLVTGLHRNQVPMMIVEPDTYTTATNLESVPAIISTGQERKIAAALGIFESAVDADALLERIDVSRSTRVTPLMFEYELVERATRESRHIVLPEGSDDRILRASEIIRRRNIAQLTLLGNEKKIKAKIAESALSLDDVGILDPRDCEQGEQFAATYLKLRKHKGVTEDVARDTVQDVSYFGTLMVYSGLADGMVSGAAHTTAHTIRPSFEIIKTAPGCSIVSSVFFMCLADRVLVYGDCAVNPNPNPEQLADIAISSAETAAKFNIEPRVAMLSYSTGESGHGTDVETVRKATSIAREMRPELLIDGPIQYDAAIDPGVAASKMPDSPVAGRATVFIFPDLNTGNTTYKAVQRASGAVAIGPVMQGLKRPVNDLSRGCTVTDIVNTVAITAIQAQG